MFGINEHVRLAREVKLVTCMSSLRDKKDLHHQNVSRVRERLTAMNVLTPPNCVLVARMQHGIFLCYNACSTRDRRSSPVLWLFSMHTGRVATYPAGCATEDVLWNHR